jgi:type I restriction enzyme M protein
LASCKITVERPLRLNFQFTPERITRLEEESSFRNLAVSKKKNAKEKAKEEAEGRKEQEAIRKMLAMLPTTMFKDRTIFEVALEKAAKAAGLKLPTPVRKAILSALSERDETAEICRDSEGNAEPDPELRDTENVPLSESIESYFERAVKPYLPDAWINTAIRDEKDNEVGKVGYEINFNRYFYKYTPPRSLEKIDADIKSVEKDILEMLREVAG